MCQERENYVVKSCTRFLLLLFQFNFCSSKMSSVLHLGKRSLFVFALRISKRNLHTSEAQISLKTSSICFLFLTNKMQIVREIRTFFEQNLKSILNCCPSIHEHNNLQEYVCIIVPVSN